MKDPKRLRAVIESERKRFGVPGTSVSVVYQGEVLLSEGFGQRNIEENLPVTSETVFPIASITKSFTSALAGMLVEDGLLEWDKPVREYLPWFQLYDPIATELVTMRDLLSHRTGLPRHDSMGGRGPGTTREEVVRRLRYLEPNKTFRQRWEYNNLMYGVAGFLTEELLGYAWEEGIEKRLLGPLGMTRSTVAGGEYRSFEDHSLPYDDKDGTPKPIQLPARREPEPDENRPRRGGPAGSIACSIDDLTQWVRAHLGLPALSGTRVLSPATLREVHRPTMLMPSGGALSFPERYGVAYALGWFIESHRGLKVVEHGGNLFGFSANVGMIPDEGIGVAVLTNLGSTAFRDAIPSILFEMLLGMDRIDWGKRWFDLYSALKSGMREASRHKAESKIEAPPSHPLEDYVGEYVHPAYGTIQIEVKEGQLLLRRGGGDANDEQPGMPLVHRHYDTWNLTIEMLGTSMPISFRFDIDGVIESLIARLEPEVKPIEFEKVARDTAPAKQLAKLPGKYAMGPIEAAVERSVDGKLSVVLPDRGRFPLRPYRDLTFKVTGHPNITVEFVVDKKGIPERIVVEPGGVFARLNGGRAKKKSTSRKGASRPRAKPASRRTTAAGKSKAKPKAKRSVKKTGRKRTK